VARGTAKRHWAGAAGRARLGALVGVLALGLSALPPHQLGAFDTLDFRVPNAPDELREALERGSLVRALEAEGRTDPLDVMAAARAEYGRLIGLLYEQGYYAPQISVRVDGQEAADMETLRPPQAIRQIAVLVEPGPRFQFGRTDVAPLAPDTDLPAGFATGEPARSTLVRDASIAAIDAWQRQGHALAEPVGQEVTAVHPDRRLDVALRLAPGPQLRFGALNPRGAEATRPDRIRAIAGLPRGEIYDPEAIADAETRLRRTGTFSSVALRTADAANPDGTIDIDALLDEAPPRRLGFGAEIDTEAGLRVTGFWLHRNLLGGAERLRVEAAIEGIAARDRGIGFTVDGRYRRPATFTRDTDLELGLRAATLDERDYDAETVQADVLLVHRFSDQLTGRAGVLLRYERARFGEPRVTRNFATLALPFGLERDTRDDPLNARSGTFLLGQIEPYLGFAGADHGARLTVDARAYTGFGGDRFVLAGRAQAGAVLGSALDRTPRQYLFYSGGGGTVRGLPFQSLGVEVDGVRSGGRGFAALSGEARTRVTSAISLVAFADAGYVAERAFGGQSGWHAGAGVGLRYDTPVGPLRLDVAVPVRRSAFDADARRVQLYLGIGQSF
jgi:translocation and assembly module TamA